MRKIFIINKYFSHNFLSYIYRQREGGENRIYIVPKSSFFYTSIIYLNDLLAIYNINKTCVSHILIYHLPTPFIALNNECEIHNLINVIYSF